MASQEPKDLSSSSSAPHSAGASASHAPNIVDRFTRVHYAVSIRDFEMLKKLFEEEDEPYPELFDDVPSPLLIAATGFEKPYYRMVTLLCHHGAQPVLELPIELLEGDIPMNVAMEMPEIGQSQEEYDYRFIMSTFYVKCAFLLNRYAHGGEDEQGNSTMMSDEALRGYLRELHDERDLALEEFKQQNPDFDTAAVDAQMQAEKLEKKKLEEERGKEGTSTTTATATSSSSPSSSSSLS